MGEEYTMKDMSIDIERATIPITEGGNGGEIEGGNGGKGSVTKATTTRGIPQTRGKRYSLIS